MNAYPKLLNTSGDGYSFIISLSGEYKHID